MPKCSLPTVCKIPEDDPCTTWHCSTENIGQLDSSRREYLVCTPTCRDKCTNGVSNVFKCDMDSGIWNRDPVRCCPNVQQIHVGDQDASCDAITAGEEFHVTVPETWKEKPFTEDKSTWVKHGTYLCSEMEDFEVRLKSSNLFKDVEKRIGTPVTAKNKICSLTQG